MLNSGPKLSTDLFVWSFIPHWAENGRLSGYTYDTPETKVEYAQAFHSLNLPWVWQPIVAGSLDDVVAQVARQAQRQPTVVFNFCDGDDAKSGPGVSVVRALEAAGIPFTGADSAFFQLSTSKVAMKEKFVKAGVATAPFAVLPAEGPVGSLCSRLPPPLFVKPNISCGSYGISVKSVVSNDAEIEARRDALRNGEYAGYFSQDVIFVESFIDGPEFTVFVGGYWDEPEKIWHLPPAQRVFDDSIPQNERFLSYDRYWSIYQEESPPPSGRPFYTYRSSPEPWSKQVVALAKQAYQVVGGSGYARVDIRLDLARQQFLVLEVNANCGLSGDDESSCGSILQMAGLDFPWLVEKILLQTMGRKAG